MSELKRIDHAQGWFMANGKKYIIETSFSIERYVMYQRFQLEAGFGVSFEKMFSEWEHVIEDANALKFADIVIRAYNISRGMMNLEQKEPAVLKMCALFCNTEDEDRRTINDDMISRKIEDWKSEAIDITDFFTLAAAIIGGFMNAYKRLSQTTTQEATQPQ